MIKIYGLGCRRAVFTHSQMLIDFSAKGVLGRPLLLDDTGNPIFHPHKNCIVDRFNQHASTHIHTYIIRDTYTQEVTMHDIRKT